MINRKLQFYCSRNLVTFHRMYLRLVSVSFLSKSPSFFMKSQFGVTSSFLLKLSFFRNQIFKDKKRRSIGILNYYHLLYLTVFVAYITFIISLFPQMCVWRLPTDSFMCQVESDDVSKRVSIYSKFMLQCYKCYKNLIFKVTLYQVCFKLNKY